MRVKHLTKAAAIAGAVAMPLAVAVPAAHAGHDPAGSAFALSAAGPVAVPATPSVTSAAAKPTSKSVAELSNPVVQARVLNASAGAGLGRASVVDLNVPKARLRASLVAAKCVQGKGGSHLVKVTLNGKTIKTAARPNSGVSVNLDALGTASLVLNKQTRDAHGKLTVTAIELTLPVGPGKTETISIASATCGATGGGPPSRPGKPENPAPSPTTPPSAPPSQAPAPTPVPGDLPVTG